MAENGDLSTLLPSEGHNESIGTTLRVIMDVLKSHDGSIKQLQEWLDSQGDRKNMEEGKQPSSFEDKPIKDSQDVADDRSEVSSIMSSRTEYRELPTKSTLIDSSLMTGLVTSTSGLNTFKLSDIGNGLTSTPSKSSPPQDSFQQRRPVAFQQSALDTTMSTIQPTSMDNVKTPQQSFPYRGHTSKAGPEGRTPKIGKVNGSPKFTPIGSYSNVALQAKIHLLENQVSEWGDIIDEMSDRMANQPSLIRKFAKESVSDKVSQRAHSEDLGEIERRLMSRIDEKFVSLDRKVIELYDDIMSQMGSLSTTENERKFAKQDSFTHMNIGLETLTKKFEEHRRKIKDFSKGLSDLGGKCGHVEQELSLYRRQMESKRSDAELVSLVAEQLQDKEDITGWKLALKEIHGALNKQSEINSSLHHSYATVDKRMEAIIPTLQLAGRWRWTGVSNLYPRSHSCVAEQQPDDVSFGSQLKNSEPRAFVWEKNKPYVAVIVGGCYWVTVGAFSRKSSTPPSLQITIDEEPVSLFNSSGKSPSHHRISVISSAPKHPGSAKHKTEGASACRPGSSLMGAIVVAAHSRISVSPTSTVSGTRLSVEGYLELRKMY